VNYLEVLKDLISINTTVPPGLNYDKAIDYLEPLFKELGFDTQRIIIPAEHAEGREGRVNLVCHRREKGKPRLQT
jgi:acetylornithine deacetylase/succinyl-diaminopimelate desuccinylase-like protein